jgi:basic membrane protein A
MRNRIFVVLTLVVLLSVVLAACATGGGGTTAGKKLKVGLITDIGGVNDKSFNQSAWAGVQKALKEACVDGKFIESKQPTDY